MSLGKTILGALGGLAAGAIAGILFAPETGSENSGYDIMEVENVHVRPRIAKLDEPIETKAEPYYSTKHLTEIINNTGKTTYEEPKKRA